MPISEQDAILALQAARAFSDDPAKVAKAKTIHDAYKRQQEAAGKPLWPETERAKVEDATKMRAMFQDRERHGFDEETFSEFSATFPDPEKKARFLNSQFLSRVFQRSTDEIRSLGTQYRDEYAKQTWGEPVKTEGEFYEKLAGDFDLEDEIGKRAAAAALSGARNVDALSKLSEEFGADARFSSRSKQWQDLFLANASTIRGKVAPYQTRVASIVESLREKTGLEDSKGETPSYRELAENLLEVPEDDRALVISAIINRGTNGDEAARKGYAKKLAESFGRGLLDYTENIPANLERNWALGVRNQIESGFPVSEEDAADPEKLLAAATSQLTATTAGGLAGIGDVTPAPSVENPTKPSEDVKAGALALADKLIDGIDLRGRLRSIAENDIDPATSQNIAARGFLQASRSMPYTLVSLAPGGFLLNSVAMSETSYQQLRAQNPDMTAGQAQTIAAFSGPLQAGLERISGNVLTGKLPAFNRFANQVAITKGAVAGRFAARLGAATGIELAQENAQDLTPALTQGVFSALSEDVPGVDWSARFGEMGKNQGELFFAVLPLALMGAGIGTARDYGAAKSMLGNYDMLRAVGLTEAAASEVRAKAIAGDVKAAQDILRQEFRKSGTDQVAIQQAQAEAIPRLIEQREALRELVNRAGDIDLLPAIRNNGEGSWSLEYNDGSRISFQTYEEADARRWQVASDENLSLNEDTRETIRRIDSDLEAGRELKYLFALDAPTLGDAQARGDVTAEDAANRLDIADATTPELDAEFEEATVAANLAGLSREERAASARILGSSTNEFRDGIVRTTMRLYQGATPLTIIEEKTEGDAKFMVRQLGLRKWMVSSLREWERVTGDRVFRAVAAGEETDQDIVEAWSAMAQAYFIGRNKDGEGVGWNRAKLAKALQTQLAGPLTGYARLFNAVLKRAAMIEKAKVEGTFDGDLEQFLERSTGMSEQRRFERAVVKEGGGIANELSQTDSKSIDGATFSIADFSDSRAQPQDGDVTLFQDGTRLVGPTTFSILAYHGTPHKVDKFSTENIGTGEGAQAYGWGLYFAQDQFVARDYKNKLGRKLTVDGEVFDNSKPRHRASFMLGSSSTPARAIERLEDGGDTEAANILRAEKVNEPILKDTGNLYTVRLKPDDDRFLDWDKPLSEQSEYIKRTVEPIVRKYILENDAIVRQEFKDSVSEGSVLGSKLYQTISGERQIETRATDSRKAGSEFLLESGIKGIRYLDGNSRNQGQGSYNYVIFDENDIEILEENSQPVKREEVGPTFSILPTSESDARYLELAKDPEGNRVELQRMVDEAAKKAGYNVGPVFHGTNARFTVFSKGGRLGIYATPDESLARQYGERVLRIFAKVNRGARIDAELTTAESAKSGVDQLVSLLEKFDAIQAYPKEGNREILFREDVSLKSADPITYDESGNVIPLSRRFDSTRDEITYSILPADGNLDDTFARMFSPFQRSPELRMKLGFEMRDRAIGISRQVAPIIRANRTKGSIEAERKTRENDIFGEKLEALGGAFVSQLDAANLDDASARPILAELLRRKTYQRKDGKVVSYWGGSLMSKGEAKRRGMDTTGGEWDDIPEGLPGYVWGGGLSPDQAAAMLGFDSIPAFWTALQSEIDSFKAIQQQAEEANREISRLRKEAREESQTWADRALKDRETVGTDRATLLAFLRTLEAITRALPAEVRGKIGGAVALARLKGPGAMLDEIEDRVEKIDRELEKWMRDEAEARRKKLFKQAKPARDKSGKAPKGKAGADIHSLFDRLREALLWDGDTAEAWAVGLEAKAAGGELSVEEEAHARIEANLVRLFSDWKNADAARRTAAVDAAHTVFLNGYLEEQKRVAAERERREAARQEIRATVGKLGKRAERVAKAQQDAGFSGKIKEGFLSLFNFEQVAGFALGEGSKWARWFANAERTASAQYTDETQSTLDGLDDLFTELGGGTRLGGERLQWKLSQPSFDTAQGGRMSELQGLTALLMWRQEDGRRHMGGKRDDAGNVTSSWSYDESFIREIEANLSTEAFAVLDYLTEQYAGEWETLNPIFRELNGIDLPRHANYAPLSAKPQQAPGGQTQDPLSGSMNSASMTPGSLRTRAQTIAEPDFVNAVEKFVSHKKQLAHWKAYALFNRDAQAILGNREVGNSIEAKGGAEAVSVLRKWLDYFAQGGVRDAGAHLALNRALSSMVGRASAMQLVGRVGTLLVQVTQLGAAPAKMPTGAYVARLSKLLTGNLGWGAALDSPYIQRRLATMPPSVQIAMEGLRAGKPNAIKHAAQRLGRLIAGADALFTAGTFAMVHDYQFSRLVKSGVDPVAANELALAEAERITDEIAQPTRAGARSLFEVTTTNPLGRLAWAFGSEARKNAALLAYSAMQRTPTEAARAALYVFLFNAGISTLIRTAWRDARDDEEKETDWDPRKLLLSAMAEPLYGIPVVGDAAQDAIFSAAGQWMPQGGLIQLKNAPGAVGDIFTGEGDSRDVETILMTLGLGSDSFAAAASLMHLYRDAEALIRNATN